MLDILLNNLWGCTLLFVVALGVLIKSSDIFTNNAEKLGMMMGIPPFIVGVTIVSIGTSLPELATSIFSVIQGSSEYVLGNVIGSNIANILLIVGIISVITRKMTIKWNILKIDLPLLMGSAILLALTAMDGAVSFGEGIILFIGMLFYIIYAMHTHNGSKIKKEKFRPIVLLYLGLSGAFIYFGAKYTIDSILAGVQLPVVQSLGVDTSIVALTVVAVGTSLPELMVSLSAARKGNFEVALGNVVGSNIFNSFLVTSIPAFFATLEVSQSTMMIGLPVMLGATVLHIFASMDREVTRYEGGIYLLFYAFFIGKLIGVL